MFDRQGLTDVKSRRAPVLDDSRALAGTPGAKVCNNGMEYHVYRSEMPLPPSIVDCPSDGAQLDIWDNTDWRRIPVIFHCLSAHHS